MSDGIYSCPMDPMESIGTTLHPFLRIDEIFLSVIRTETPHVRWNPFVSDGIFIISVLLTDGLPVFRWKADDVRWSLVDSIGQPSYNTLFNKIYASRYTEIRKHVRSYAF